jgi:hypothetical protein
MSQSKRGFRKKRAEASRLIDHMARELGETAPDQES